MKKLAIAIIFFLVTGVLFADNDSDKKSTPAEPAPQTVILSGCVVDFSSGESLTGVEVQIEGTDIKTYTDFDGNFEFPDMKPGNYNIIASYISYEKSLIENLSVAKAENEVDIKLQSSK